MYRHEIDEKNKTLDLWVRRKRGNRKLECSGCGHKFQDPYDCRERAVRDLPWSEFQAAVHIEVYRVKCPNCGVKVEKVPLLPSKAPFSKRFEEVVGQACESAAARQVARRFGSGGEHGAGDRPALSGAMGPAARRKPALRQMGVDEIYLGKKDKFLTVVSNLETGEPLWFGKERKKETLDEFFRTQLSERPAQTHRGGLRGHVGAVPAEHRGVGSSSAASSMTSSTSCSTPTTRWTRCGGRSSSAKGGRCADVVKGKKWLLLSRWKNLAPRQRGVLNRLFQLNRRRVQSLPAQREPGATVGLPLRGSDAQLPAEVDRSTAVAAPALRFRSSPRCCSSTSTAS